MNLHIEDLDGDDEEPEPEPEGNTLSPLLDIDDCPESITATLDSLDDRRCYAKPQP